MSAQRALTASMLETELVFSTSRSSGPGGQNVNKVNTKVTLRFDVANSVVLNEEEKVLLFKKLASKLTNEGVLVISSQDKRSQLQNKEAALIKLERLLSRAFEKKKPRRKTKPSKQSVQDRLAGKKKNAEKKKWRQKP